MIMEIFAIAAIFKKEDSWRYVVGAISLAILLIWHITLVVRFDGVGLYVWLSYVVSTSWFIITWQVSKARDK